MYSKTRPKMRVSITLSGRLQDALLHLLHKHLGISESYPEDHTIVMTPEKFVDFLFAVEKSPVSCTLSQMKASYIDFSKTPRVTVVRSQGINYQLVDKDNG